MAKESRPKQAAYDQFLLLGDSITQQMNEQVGGFVIGAKLASDYSRRLDIINRGFGGYNTSQALHVLPSLIPHPTITRIRLMTIFLGANDACLPTYETQQHVPLPTYTQNLHAILTHPSIQAHSARLILITPPPVDEHRMREMMKLYGSEMMGRTVATTKTYADACREVAKRCEDVALVDLWAVMMERAGWREGEGLPGDERVERSGALGAMLSDGLHFKPLGYEILYKELTRVVAKRWPDQTPENCEMVIPMWMVAEPRDSSGHNVADYH